MTKRCRHFGCCLAGRKSADASVWRASPAHPEKPWAVRCEIRPGCLKTTAYVESRRSQPQWLKRRYE